MERKQLTDEVIAALTPKRKRRLVYDREVRSLAVSVSPKGKKTFVVVKRLNGAKHSSRRRLGVVGRITIAQARERALKFDARPSDKLADVADNFFKHIQRQRRAEEVERCIRRDVLPQLGGKAIGSITKQDVREVVNAVKARGKLGAARHVLAYTKRLFSYAVHEDLIDHNPCSALDESKLLGPKPRRKRVLSDDEIKAVWLACDKLATPYALLCQLLLVTMQRRSDVADAPRDEFNTKARLWSIPPERFKSDVPHLVPLSQLALDILEGDSDRLFHITGWSKLKKRLDRYVRAELRKINPRATLPNWTLHDLRRTGRTRLSEKALGVPYEVREAVIGHSKKDLDRVYDQYDFLEEKREALDAWAARLSRIVSDTKGISVP